MPKMSDVEISKTAQMYLGAARMRICKSKDPHNTAADKMFHLERAAAHYEMLDNLISDTGKLPPEWKGEQ